MQTQSPDLSAQEVNLLHQIVLRAQDHIDHQLHPSKTLFEAYDAVFAENGLDTKHDRACLRLLLQLGRPNTTGESLYEKFEHLLEQAGIVLRFEEDVSSVTEASVRDPQEYMTHVADAHNSHPILERRRNSFTSIHDVTANQNGHLLQRRQSSGSEPRMTARGVSQSPRKLHQQIYLDHEFTDKLDVTKPRTDLDSRERFLAAGHHAELLLRPSELQQAAPRMVEPMEASQRAVEIMDIALLRDRSALLRQAFSNWLFGTQIKRQERRLYKIEAALEQQHAHIAQRADETYHRCLLAKAFCHWMFMAMNAKAKTDAARVWLLRHKYLMAWQRFTVKQELQTMMPLKRKVFHVWLSKYKIDNTQHEALEPRIQRMSDWRIARTVFRRWQDRSQALICADGYYTDRVKRNALSIWRLGCRSTLCRELTSERVQRDKLKSWLLGARCAATIRDRNIKSLRRILNLAVNHSTQQQSVFSSKVESFVADRKPSLLRSAWRYWIEQHVRTKDNNQTAVDHYRKKIQRHIVGVWCDRVRHTRRHELRAYDGLYYFLVKKAFRSWKSAFASSTKSRTNEAYKQIRFMVKRNTMLRAFGAWRTRVDSISDMQQLSHARIDEKTRAMVQNLFLAWQVRSSQLHQCSEQASSHYESVLVRRTLAVVLDTSSVMNSYHARAEAFHSIRISEICRSALRRLSHKAFEAKRRREDADAIRERHFAKHVRSVLRHWHGKTKDVTLVPHKTSPMSTDPGHEPTDAGYGTGTGTTTAVQSFTEHPVDDKSVLAFGETQQNEDWTAFDHDLVEVSQTPGYLNTPSKRAARMRALVHASTTPATPRTAHFGRSRFGPPSKRAHLFRDMG